MKQKSLGKRISAGFLSFALVLTTINMPAFTTEAQAEENLPQIEESIFLTENSEGTSAQAEETMVQLEAAEALTAQIEGDTYQLENSGMSSEEMFAGYVYQQFYGNYGISTLGTAARDYLTGQNRIMYDAIKPMIQEVAAGQRSSTRFSVPLTSLIGEKLSFTASELGVEQIVVNGAVSQAAIDAMFAKIAVNSKDVVNALSVDMPYEMYWRGDRISRDSIAISCVGNENGVVLRFASDAVVTLKIAVSNDYAGNEEYTTNLTKTSATVAAVANANSIVANAQYLHDPDKLAYYRDEICRLTTYNSEAASDDYAGGYGDPWQMIYVFDGDPKTTVVCEGYSKAFKYLCDMSEFEGDIYTYIVSGDMAMGAPGEGPHMWNMIHMDDGRNYLADITNYTNFNELYLAPASSGSVEAGYYLINTKWDPIFYSYDEDALREWSLHELTLSSLPYGEGTPVEQLHDFGEDGVCSICGRAKCDVDGKHEFSVKTDDATKHICEVCGVTENHEFDDECSCVCGAINHVYTSDCDTTCDDCGYVRADAAENHNFFNEDGTLSTTCTVCEEENQNKCGTNAYWLFSEDNTLYVYGTGAVNHYNNGAQYTPWYEKRSYIKKVVVEKGITELGNYCFHTVKMTDVELPEGLLKIGNSSFRGCSNLTGIEIPGSVTTIGPYAFISCSAVKEIVLHEGLENIGEQTFYVGTGLAELIVPDSVTSIGRSAVWDSVCTLSVSCKFTANDISWKSKDLIIRDHRYADTTPYESIDDAEHGMQCDVCKKVISLGNHEYSADCDATCNDCGYERIAMGTHKFNCVGHCIKCDIFDANEVGNEKHDFLDEDSANYGGEKCTSCDAKNINHSTLKIKATSATYNGKAQTAVITGIDAANYSVTGNVATDAGKYTITLTGKNAYAGTREVEWTIGKATPKVVAPTSSELKYSGKAVALIKQGNSDFGDILYSVEKEGEALVWTNKVPVTDGPGEYKVYYKVEESDNWFGVEQQYIVVTVEPEQFEITFKDAFNNEITRHSYDYGTKAEDIDLPSVPTILVAEELLHHTFTGWSPELKDVDGPATYTATYQRVDHVYNKLDPLHHACRICNGLENHNWASEADGLTHQCTGCGATENHYFIDQEGRPVLECTVCNASNTKKCGENVYYAYSKNGRTLYIYGSGPMNNEKPDWYTMEYNNITNVIISEGVTTIGDYAFYFCRNLRSITIPEGVVSIGTDAFAICTCLESITIPSTVTSIGNVAFDSCERLTEIIIPNSVKSIGITAFSTCINLNRIVVPCSVTDIGPGMFYGSNPDLEIVVAPESKMHEYALEHRKDFDQTTGRLNNWKITTTESHEFTENAEIVKIDGNKHGKECLICQSIVATDDHDFSIEDAKNKEALAYEATCTEPAKYYKSCACGAVSDKEEDIFNYGFGGIGHTFENALLIGTSNRAELYCQRINVVVKNGEKVTEPCGYMLGAAYVAATAEKKVVKAGETTTLETKLYNKLNSYGLPGELTDFQWYIGEITAEDKVAGTPIKGANASTYQLPTNLAPGAYTYVCVAKCDGCEVKTSVSVVVEQGIEITTQPKAVTATEGTNATFKVAATGTGLTYQWQYSQNNGSTWIKSGAASSVTDTYILGAKASRNGYLIRCIVKDANGQKVISEAVKLTVKPAGPVITTQPKAVTATEGTNATFKVAATGTGLTYQWQYSQNNGSTWIKSGAASSVTDTYVLGAKASRNGYLIRCIVKDANGETVTSAVVKLTVKPAGPVITTQPEAVTVVEGKNATFKIAATGTGLTYQWQYSQDNGTTWKNSSAASSVTDTYILGAKASRNGYLIRCIVKDANGETVTSEAVKMTVKPAGPVITTQPEAVTATEGKNATFKVVATGTGLTYQWQYSQDEGKTWKNSSAASSVTASYVLGAKASRNGYLIRCIVKDANGETVTSEAVKMTVKPVGPVITTQPKSVTTAEGKNATFKIAATGTGLTYQWQYSQDNGTTWKNSSAASSVTASYVLGAKASRNGYLIRCVVTDANGQVVTSEAVKLTVTK